MNRNILLQKAKGFAMHRLVARCLLAAVCGALSGCGPATQSKRGAITVEQEQAEFEEMHIENMRQGGALPPVGQ